MAGAHANGTIRPEPFVILVQAETPDGIRLTLSGRMTANGIGEFRRLLYEARRRHKTVHVDLGEVTLLDPISAEFLNSVAGPKVQYENCPGYLRRWISGAKTTA
jgi:hypothetical protein